MRFRRWLAVVLAAGALLAAADRRPSGPFQATGIKIVEVSEDRAVVWTRLTRRPERRGKDDPLPVVRYHMPHPLKWFPWFAEGWPDWRPVVAYRAGSDVHTIEGAVPGAAGQVRVRYRRGGQSEWRQTVWQANDPESDFTARVALEDLRPGSEYEIRVEGRADERSPVAAVIDGRFRTAPERSRRRRVLFTSVTGQEYLHQDSPEGFRIYGSMLALDPDFFVHTGDAVYYDRLAKNIDLARWHWARTYSLPSNVEFHRQVASYFMKDDHDTWMNDCYPSLQTRYMGEFTFAQGQRVFCEQTGAPRKTYRTFRWGKDLQVWLLEGRDHRSPNPAPDGPAKTILGQPQKQWLKRTLRASDATFRVVISPTPIVGPDRSNKGDNHANPAFATEGRELRRFLGGEQNVFLIAGDRHWQYVSVDEETGLREYGCGPASDAHAGGFSARERTPAVRYLHVGGGFLAVTAERSAGAPHAIFQHFSVDGELLHEERHPAAAGAVSGGAAK